MIRQIRGPVLSVGTTSAIIEVAGFGIEVFLASPELLKAGDQATLATYLAVKQDGIDLYGFSTQDDRTFFEKLITVSGIGPKTALSIMRRSPREGLENAIARRDITYLTRVAGLGKKSAEKLAVELSEKLGDKTSVTGSDDAEVFDTLVALGYTEREARHALTNVAEGISGKEARLKAALSSKA